jgi:hypothetical protein
MTDVALRPGADPLARARLHTMLRFAVGVTGGFVLAELMGWAPTFLVPLLTAVLLANLPFSPPLKVGLLLAGVMTLSALFAFALSSVLIGSPTVLFGCLAVIIFSALYTMAKGQAALPMTLLLLCVSAIPIVTMVVPAYADLLPIAMARGMAVAVLIVWTVFAIWPQTLPPAAKPPAAAGASPLHLALTGTAIIMPLLLAYLTLGLTDALPVLITTVLLVATFDVSQGALQGMVMVLGNVFGGFVGFVAVVLLSVTPSLTVLALVTFLVTIIAAEFITRGGGISALALLSCNQAMVIFSIALANPDSSSGIWFTRLFQFSLAWLFAIGMMWLMMPRRRPL